MTSKKVSYPSLSTSIVSSVYRAVALRPCQGPVRLREQFQARTIKDERLLNRLTTLASQRASTDPNHSKSVFIIDALIKSYVERKNTCSICALPMTLDPISSGQDICSDWCLGATHIPPYRVAHVFCAERERTTSPPPPLAADREVAPGEILREEQESLQSMLVQASQIEKKAIDNDQDKGEVLWMVMARMLELRDEMMDLLRRANESPFCESSRWSDSSKTKLEKRCHKLRCCGEWNPASVMRPRRLFKLGQMDSNDYFDYICPFRGRKHARPSSEFNSTVATAAAAAASEKCELSAAMERAKAMIVAQEEAGCEFVAERRRMAQETYDQHRRLMQLYVGAGCSVLLPSPAPAAAEEDQWCVQKGMCAECGRPMELYDLLHWDLCRGAWYWLHARCNRNAWAQLMPRHVLSGPAEYKQLYNQRHNTDALFEQVLCAVLKCSKTHPLTLPLVYQLLNKLRARLTNLTEQLHIQMRFSPKDGPLKSTFNQLIHTLQSIDPDAAAAAALAALNDAPAPRTTTTNITISKSTNKETNRIGGDATSWRTRKKYKPQYKPRRKAAKPINLSMNENLEWEDDGGYNREPESLPPSTG